MDKYQEIVSKLKIKEVVFDLGISSTEIKKIEEFYDISFPAELKNLYFVGLPVSNGFYNWRDMSDINIERIKEVLKKPIIGLQSELQGDFWCDDWGDKPNDINEAYKILLTHYNNAPQLIPIYSHRYVPFIENNGNIPIFSIVGSDVIYYGENLISYLEIEFGLKKYSEFNQINCQHITFWSDLI